MPKEYHYTLYYYDQAGNLAQTVPPNGVKPLDAEQLLKFLQGDKADPEHTYLRRTKYNVQDEVIWGSSVNTGEANSWYDSKEQLRMSQNAQQRKENAYSYARFDVLGRTVESGEFVTATPLTELLSQLDDPAFPQASASIVLRNVVNSYYDSPNAATQATFVQQNLRNRISWIEYRTEITAEPAASYYTYDIHGNIDAVMQHVPGLGDKRIDYAYDLLSGNTNYVFYQHGHKDQFIHRYKYDAENRMIEAATSTDGYTWDADATYKYYSHGTLARTEIGHYQLQGIDRFYTLQGWLKGVNMPYANDPGNDGYTGINRRTARDVFSFTLGYYKDDYKPINAAIATPDTRDRLWERYEQRMGTGNIGYYNSNIAWMVTDLRKVAQTKQARVRGMQAMLYRYDQLARIVKSRSLAKYIKADGFAVRTDDPAPYDEDYLYDPNGNILTLNRKDEGGATKDDLSYTYYRNTDKLRYHDPIDRDTVYTAEIITNNKLYRRITVEGTAYVADGKEATIRAVENIDVDKQFKVSKPTKFHAYIVPPDEGAYMYDAIGNLVVDRNKGVQITWDGHGKVTKVESDKGLVVTYRHNAAGYRIEKKVQRPDNSGTITHYVPDNNGNVMAVYEEGGLIEQPVYGMGRLGVYTGGRHAGQRKLGMKKYELTNHLGNVLSVIKDNIHITPDSVWAEVISTSDYYPFGLAMNNRSMEPALDPEITADIPPTPGLLAQFTMDGNATDGSGNGFNGTIIGATPTTDSQGNANSAYAFDGDDRITIPNSRMSTSFIQNTAVFTITAYVKFNSITGRNVIVSSGSATTSKAFVFMYENYNAATGLQQLRFSYTTGSASYVFNGAKNAIKDTNWHHVAVVGDGKTVRFYVDGMPDGAPGNVTTLATGTGTLDTFIGGIPTTGAVSLPLNGSLDEVNIFTVPLTQQQVQNLMQRKHAYGDEPEQIKHYRYGFNGQEREEELGSSITSAEFWMYDARLARRWNPDPITYTGQSPYACFNNNPVYFSDPDGLEPKIPKHADRLDRTTNAEIFIRKVRSRLKMIYERIVTGDKDPRGIISIRMYGRRTETEWDRLKWNQHKPKGEPKEKADRRNVDRKISKITIKIPKPQAPKPELPIVTLQECRTCECRGDCPTPPPPPPPCRTCQCRGDCPPPPPPCTTCECRGDCPPPHPPTPPAPPNAANFCYECFMRIEFEHRDKGLHELEDWLDQNPDYDLEIDVGGDAEDSKIREEFKEVQWRLFQRSIQRDRTRLNIIQVPKGTLRYRVVPRKK